MGACCSRPSSRRIVYYDDEIVATNHRAAHATTQAATQAAHATTQAAHAATTHASLLQPSSVTAQLPPQAPQIYFQHILEGIYDAAIKAQMNVQVNNLSNVFWFFPKDESGTHRARTVRMKIPSPDVGGEREIEVPIFTLVHQKHLTIHELKLRTKLDMEMTLAPYEERDTVLQGVNHKKYHIELIPGDKSTDLEISMHIEQPMEVMQRILHKYEALI